MNAIGLGCMRLSTARDRDETRAIAVIHAALDSGVTLIDTSDAYCHTERDVGHNERLVAEALRRWGGDRSTIEVATKGGLRRPNGAWIADGRAKHLRTACDASRQALGVDRIDCYQLHAVDPQTPLETSVRALAALQREGTIRRIGLCNVTVAQIVAARAIAEISSVQVSLSVFDDENLRNGVAEYCREHGIRLIAHRPLGGERGAARLARDPDLVRISERSGRTPHEVALAWLMDLAPNVVPVPGSTRTETARSIGRALALELTAEDRQRLDARFSGRLLRVPRAQRRPLPGARGEVVLIMGMPGAGKSGIARELQRDGYERLNRDERGGSLADLVEALDAGLAAGQERWALDNTYASRAARNDVIECAWKHGAPVRCIHVTTAIADAQVNAISRLLEIHGRLPSPEELREHGRSDPRYFGPDAQFRYERTVEPPHADEGFTVVDTRAFERRHDAGREARGLVLEYDGVLCVSARGGETPLAPDDIMFVDGRADQLRAMHAEGWRLFAHAWRPQVARGEVSRESVEACFERTRELLGVDIALAYCPHDAGPPICWCRKPLPGMILEFARAKAVDLGRSLYVGRSPADRTIATRLGMTYLDARTEFVPGSA